MIILIVLMLSHRLVVVNHPPAWLLARARSHRGRDLPGCPARARALSACVCVHVCGPPLNASPSVWSAETRDPNNYLRLPGGVPRHKSHLLRGEQHLNSPIQHRRYTHGLKSPPSQPPHNHLTTTSQPPHNHLTTSRPPHNHLTTTSQQSAITPATTNLGGGGSRNGRAVVWRG